jgi:hypothetical protein
MEQGNDNILLEQCSGQDDDAAKKNGESGQDHP